MLSSKTLVASRITRNTPVTIIAATNSESGRIDPRDVRQRDRDAAGDDGRGAEDVTQDVKERRANVQVALALPVQHDADAHVEDEPDRRDGGHRHRVRLDRRGEAPNRRRRR